MRQITRRDVIKGSIAGGFFLGFNEPSTGLNRRLTAAGPNAQVRVAIVGLGGIDVIGGVGGRGRQLIRALQDVPEARIVTLCDVDEEILGVESEKLKNSGPPVATHRDLRRVLDDKNIDAIFVATPNHWHALATIWACQAGKDVYVEKPFSHSIWEGKQMMAAARKYNRIVQVGTQRRSSVGLRQAIEYLQAGELGDIQCARAIVYRPRDGIGNVNGPTPIPKSVDYDLWCGPAAKSELRRKQLHYEWHWFWSTGNGEIGNNGAHEIDVCRWALGQNKAPSAAISIGGRFGFGDAGETPNTQITVLDYQPAPLICEIRNLVRQPGSSAIGSYKGLSRGVVVECEGGYFLGDISGGELFDNDSRKVKEFRDSISATELEAVHVSNFVQGVQSRDAGSLKAEALEGHLSAICVHTANVSHRLGQLVAPKGIVEHAQSNGKLTDAFQRCQKYLLENGVDLDDTRAVLGPQLSFDADEERFIGEFGEPANQLSRRDYRVPFVVPDSV